MTKFTLPLDLPSTERLFKAGYFTLATNLDDYLRRGTPLNEGEREVLTMWFLSGPDSPDPFAAYEPWELESDFHELFEALKGVAACPASHRDLVGLPGGVRETRARQTRSKGRSSRAWARARDSRSASPTEGAARPSDARAPDAA